MRHFLDLFEHLFENLLNFSSGRVRFLERRVRFLEVESGLERFLYFSERRERLLLGLDFLKREFDFLKNFGQRLDFLRGDLLVYFSSP